MTDVKQVEDNPSVKKKIARTSYRVANTLFPLGEMTSLGKTTTRSLTQTVKRANELRKSIKKANSTQLTFSQAVGESGMSKPQLIRKFTLLKRFWWVISLTGVIMMPLLLIMILLAFKSLPGIIIIRALTYFIIFTLFSAVAISKVIVSELRLWQLSNERLTPEDKGTFNDFRQSDDWIKRCITPF